jgi:hypothetical protein
MPIDFSALNLDNSDFTLPERVEGRVLNKDADFTAYQAAGSSDTKAGVIQKIKESLSTSMELAGATDYHLHLTASDSNKAGRYKMATVQPYQEKRQGVEKPELLDFAKSYMAKNMKCTLWSDREADDGLAKMQTDYIADGKRNLIVLDSADKDLRMVQGLHLCPETAKIVDVKGYGACWYDSAKGKVLGWGTSFFWHQVLMGDYADSIPGLPAYGEELSVKYWPTKDITELKRRLKWNTMPSGKELTAKQRDAAEHKLHLLIQKVKQKPSGAKAAFDYLSRCTNDAEAYKQVCLAYQSYYGSTSFAHTSYDGKEMQRSCYHMLYEQAYLLWMQRNDNWTDVMDFINELGECNE